MPTIYAIAGGKGGIGKSVVSILLAQSFAYDHRRCILVDADLGGANLHTLLGIGYPRAGLVDFLQKRTEKLEEVLHFTKDKNVKLISGAGEVLGMTNLKAAVREKAIRHIKNLGADDIIIDLGAGSSFNVIDFFLAADKNIIVVAPEPTALQNAYMFLKFCVQRILFNKFYSHQPTQSYLKRFIFPNQTNAISTVYELVDRVGNRNRKMGDEIFKTVKNFKPWVIVNMVENQAESLRYFSAVSSTASKYLGVETSHLGTIFLSRDIKDAIKRHKSLLEIKLGINNYPLAKIKSTLYKEKLVKTA